MPKEPSQPLVKVNFACPPKLLENFDRYVKTSGQFKNRTDALLVLMRSLVDSEDVPLHD